MTEFIDLVFSGLVTIGILHLYFKQARMEKRIEILENDVKMLLELELKK